MFIKYEVKILHFEIKGTFTVTCNYRMILLCHNLLSLHFGKGGR